MKVAALILSLACGLLFGIGLSLSGMTDTRIVLGFLDITGDWNPSLALVMAGALAVTLPAFSYLLKKQKPLLCEDYKLPVKSQIDAQLVLGSAIFGVGWGLYGYCPGPAVASLGTLNIESVVFVAALLLGMLRS